MKKHNIIKNLALVAVLISTLLVACSPDQSKEYNPELETFPEITFTSFSPTMGFPGTPITITGTNFGDLKNAATITFNGIDVDLGREIISYSDTEIVALVPNLAGTGPINLKVWTHEILSTTDFVYLPGIVISGLSTDRSIIGDQISILGSNFGTDASAISVLFSGIEANIISISNTEVVVEVPDSVSGAVSVLYDNGNRETVGPTFIYLNPSIVFDDFLEASAEFGAFDRSGTQASGFWPTTQPTNFIGDREWQLHGNNQSGRAWAYVTEGSGVLTLGPSRGLAYDISDNPSSGYTKPTLLTLEANFNLGSFANNSPTPRPHRGFTLGFLSEVQNSVDDGVGNPITGLRGVAITPDSNEIFLWDGAANNNTVFNGIERVPIPTPYDRNADHHIKLVVDTTTGQMVSFEFDGIPVTFSVSPNFSDANTKYMVLGGGSIGGTEMTVYDVSFY